MKKLLKNALVVAIITYVAVTFINQQKTLNAYKNEQQVLAKKIEEQKQTKESLLTTKENITSPEYIEQIARDKLDMYLPNERVYIDTAK